VSGAVEPVVVTICPHLPEPRHAILADVLVAVANQRPSPDWRADVFVRYAGLALLLIVGRDGEALAHFRDGTVLALTVRPDKVYVTAQFLYFSWACGFR
jgi:hypothetical protein